MKNFLKIVWKRWPRKTKLASMRHTLSVVFWAMLVLLFSSHRETSRVDQTRVSGASSVSESSLRESRVRANCYLVKRAAELFAALNNGIYPTDNADTTPDGSTVRDLLPDGNNLVNPFTGQATEPQWGAAAAQPGETGYVAVVHGPDNVGYQITGFGESWLIFGLPELRGENPSELWSQSVGNTACGDRGQGIAVDAADNVFLVGEFENIVDFGGVPLSAASGTDIFVAKYNPGGGHLWSQRFGNTGSDEGLGIAVDGPGNVLIVGAFSGTADFGGGVLTSAGGRDVLVAKYDDSGNHLWSKRFGDTTSNDQADGVIADGLGNVIVTGCFQGTVDFGGGSLVSDSIDAFVVKLDASGNHVWSKKLGGTAADQGLAVAVDTSRNIVVAGAFGDTVDFGGGALVSDGDDDGFITKYGPDGTHLWSRRFGHSSADRSVGLAVDGDGNVLATGFFQGTVDFGGGPLSGAGSEDIFLVKYDPAGNHLWSHVIGGTGVDVGEGIAIDGLGNVYVTGAFGESGGYGLWSAGELDIFVAKYDSSGAWAWSQGYGDAADDRGEAIAIDGAGNLLLTGKFQNTLSLDGGTLFGAGCDDVFLVKLHDGYLPERPFVSSILPDTVVAINTPAIDGYRDLNVVFGDVQDGSTLEFTIRYVSNPTVVNATINADSALDLSFGPGQTGSSMVFVRATDSDGLSAESIFQVNVIPSPPIVRSAIPDTTVFMNDPAIDNYRDLNKVFTDVQDGSVLSFSVENNSNPAVVNATIGADSALDLSLGFDQIGRSTIVVRATDSDGMSTEDFFEVTVLSGFDLEISSFTTPFEIRDGSLNYPLTATCQRS